MYHTFNLLMIHTSFRVPIMTIVALHASLQQICIHFQQNLAHVFNEFILSNTTPPTPAPGPDMGLLQCNIMYTKDVYAEKQKKTTNWRQMHVF